MDLLQAIFRPPVKVMIRVMVMVSFKLASYGGRSFAYAGLSNLNSLHAHLRDNSLSLSCFKIKVASFSRHHVVISVL